MFSWKLTDLRLVRKVKRGHPEAFEELVRRYQTKAYAVARAIGVAAADLEDVVQEAFLQAYRDLSQLRSMTSFGPWFLMIVRNVSRKHLRRPIPMPGIPGGDSAVAAEAEPPEVCELRDHIWREIAELPEELREVVFLYYYDGKALKEVASALRLSVSGAKRRLARARQSLRRTLWREVGECLTQGLPSPREWEVRGRRLSLLVMASIPASMALMAGRSTAQGTGTMPAAQPAPAARASRNPKEGGGLGKSQTLSAGSALKSPPSGGSFWILSGALAMKLKSVVLSMVLSLLVLAVIFQVSRPHLEDGTVKAGKEDVAGHGAAPILARPSKVNQAREPAAGIGSEENILPPRPPRPCITGLVFEEETGAPIPGAIVRVRASEHQTMSDPNGVYRLEGLAAGDYILVAGGEEYAESHASIRLLDEKDFHQDFSLDPATEVVVTVVDESDKPIEDVVVTRSQPAGDYVHSDEYSRRTGTDGRALLPGINRSKPQQLHAKKEGYCETWWKDYRFGPAREPAEGTIVLRKAPKLERVVEGRVAAKDGALLKGVSVQWIHSWGPSKGREIALTDARGYYRLRFESDRETHPISVFASGRAPVIRQDVRTGTPESPARVDFTLDEGHWLEGRVVDEDGKPVEGVVLKAMPELGSLRNPNIQPGIVRESTTDNAGLFSLEDLIGPTVAIRLVGPAGREWANNVNELVAVDNKVELTLRQWSLIRGRVSDKDNGEPLPAFRIQVEGGGKGYLKYARMNPGESFDAPDGRFQLQRLDQDEYDLTVHAEGYLSKRLEKVTAAPAGRAEELDIRMTVGRSVEGVVIDAQSGLALPQATVIFGVWGTGELTWSSWDLERMRHRQEFVTGPDGTFRFIEDDAGTIFLRAAEHARLCVPPGERRRISDSSGRLIVPLSQGAVLSGVHYQEGQPCRTGYFVPIFLPDPSGSGAEASRERLESIERNDEGRFHVEGLRPGSYWLDHYRETPGKVSAGMGTRRRVELEPGENVIEYGRDLGDIVFSGQLLDRDAKPLDGAHIFLVPTFEWHYVRFSARVDREHMGRFWIAGLRPGKYGVEVEVAEGKRLPLREIELTETTERDLAVTAQGAELPR